jgi:hypothetical protein
LDKGEEMEEERRWKLQKERAGYNIKRRERDERCRKTMQEELGIAK